jgi:hypothetical protein
MVRRYTSSSVLSMCIAAEGAARAVAASAGKNTCKAIQET